MRAPHSSPGEVGLFTALLIGATLASLSVLCAVVFRGLAGPALAFSAAAALGGGGALGAVLWALGGPGDALIERAATQTPPRLRPVVLAALAVGSALSFFTALAAFCFAISWPWAWGPGT